MTYDDTGNLTFDNYSQTNMSHSYQYDAENRLKQATVGSTTSNYVYDGDGKRVRRPEGNSERWQVYGLGGELLAEYVAKSAANAPQKEYGYRGGQLLVVYDASETGNKQWQWLVTDHLGTPRMIANLSGSLAGMKRHDYLPFGEELIAGTGVRSANTGYADDNVRQQFVGYERDNETGLDFAQARYYANVQGRFTSPDNFLNDTSMADPASWNLYAYARSNPLRYSDPTGEKIYIGDVTGTDRDELLKRANATYGCTGCVTVGDDGYLAVNTSGLSQGVIGATQFFTDAINSTTYFAQVQVSNNDASLSFGQNRLRSGQVTNNGIKTNADLIILDFGDDKHVINDKSAQGANAAFLNTVFAHEVAHGYLNLRDPKEGGETGPVVDAVNNITDALGLPRRAEYFSHKQGGYWTSIRFTEPKQKNGRPEVDKNGNQKTREVYIRWLTRNVGGKGVN